MRELYQVFRKCALDSAARTQRCARQRCAPRGPPDAALAVSNDGAAEAVDFVVWRDMLERASLQPPPATAELDLHVFLISCLDQATIAAMPPAPFADAARGLSHSTAAWEPHLKGGDVLFAGAPIVPRERQRVGWPAFVESLVRLAVHRAPQGCVDWLAQALVNIRARALRLAPFSVDVQLQSVEGKALVQRHSVCAGRAGEPQAVDGSRCAKAVLQKLFLLYGRARSQMITSADRPAISQPAVVQLFKARRAAAGRAAGAFVCDDARPTDVCAARTRGSSART